jgi:hypothetical protein
MVIKPTQLQESKHVVPLCTTLLTAFPQCSVRSRGDRIVRTMKDSGNNKHGPTEGSTRQPVSYVALQPIAIR